MSKFEVMSTVHTSYLQSLRFSEVIRLWKDVENLLVQGFQSEVS